MWKWFYYYYNRFHDYYYRPRIGANIGACVQYLYRKLTARPKSNACGSIVDGEFRPAEAEQLDSVRTLTTHSYRELKESPWIADH